MTVTVITPAQPLLEAALVKTHLGVDGTDTDTLIDAYIAAASAYVDGPDGVLGRSFGTQTLELRLDEFGTDPIELSCPPVASVTSVKYLDGDGAEQTLASDQYTLLNDGRLALANGASWPSILATDEAVRIRYVAGGADVPPALVPALLLMIGDWFQNRETVGQASELPLSAGVKHLLGRFKNWSV